MDSQRLNLGIVPSVRAEVFGEPGSRTFRILAETDEGKVSLWLEKEQVVMLRTALHDLLESVTETSPPTEDPGTAAKFVGDLEVKVGSLAIGYDPESHGFTLEAGDFESLFGLETIGLLATRAQFAALADQIEDILSGSRPRCPLCGTPLTADPHFCPGRNGHARTTPQA